MDRYHQVLERVEAVAPETGSPADVDPALAPDLAALAAAGAQLMDLHARVHEVCLAAQALAPSDGADIPPGAGGILLDVHRALARAATLVAQAAESVTLVLVGVTAGRPEERAAATLSARRASEQAEFQVARAEVLIQRVGVDDGA